MAEEETQRRRTASALFIPAGLFLGMGIGWAFEYMMQGIFIGIGAGFAAFAIGMIAIRD